MIGTQIQNYEVASQIGSGGIGVVYLACHRILKRSVAIKVLHERYAQDELMVGRFLNEARAANAIRHPNVVMVLDVGTSSTGQPYIVMEYLEGESLGARLAREGRLPWMESLAIAEQVAAGLSAAHDRDVIHRDIKPDNVFLLAQAELGVASGSRPAAGAITVKLLDFGIAKLRDDLAGSLVQTGDAVLGSPLNMSPEQCRGLSGQVDRRTDVYSFGVLLYQMMCGRPPFLSEAWGDVLIMHISRSPPPLRTFEPSVPADVEAAVLRAIAKKPEDRFPTVEALMVALRRAAAAEVTAVVEPPPARLPFSRLVRGWRRSLAVAVLVTGAVVGGVAVLDGWEQPAVSLPRRANDVIGVAEAATAGASAERPLLALPPAPAPEPAPAPTSTVASRPTSLSPAEVRAERSVPDIQARAAKLRAEARVLTTRRAARRAARLEKKPAKAIVDKPRPSRESNAEGRAEYVVPKW